MSVFNGARSLLGTLDSVLGQQDCRLEFVVVNDGSTDETAAILDAYAQRDPRLRVFHQSNTGLTKALIRGCAEAKGSFIARQDAEDLSLPGRFKEQCDFLSAHPDVVLVAGGVRNMAPGGEWIGDYEPPDDIQTPLDITRLKLPPLMGTMFRRDAYLRVGGFRPQFVVSQDVDLWLRLLEAGPCKGLRRPHYQQVLTLGGISSRRREEQVQACRHAIECALCRRSGQPEPRAPAIAVRRSSPARKMRGYEKARFHYFLGTCLRHHNPEAAMRYFRLAIRENPLHLKALIRYIQGWSR